ncbi:hypothetical protein XarjCFBP7653_20755 [Xanthomonas arboricola]|nr:hypothetical protein XarjCFBP7653_20755 [Xanthomonas arboricola]
MGHPGSIGACLCDACKHFGAYTGAATGVGARASARSESAATPAAHHGRDRPGCRSTATATPA